MPKRKPPLPPLPKGSSYTPTPAVKSMKKGVRGGVIHDSRGRVIGTAKSEDSPMNRRGTKRASTRSTRPR